MESFLLWIDSMDWGRKVPRLGRLLDRLGGSRFKVGRQVCSRRLVVGRVVCRSIERCAPKQPLFFHFGKTAETRFVQRGIRMRVKVFSRVFVSRERKVRWKIPNLDRHALYPILRQTKHAQFYGWRVPRSRYKAGEGPPNSKVNGVCG